MDLPPVPELDATRWDLLIATATTSQPWEAAEDLVPELHVPGTSDEVDVVDDLEMPDGEDHPGEDLDSDWHGSSHEGSFAHRDDLPGHDLHDDDLPDDSLDDDLVAVDPGDLSELDGN